MCVRRCFFSLFIVCAFICQTRSQKIMYGAKPVKFPFRKLSQPFYVQNSHNYGGYICYPTNSPGQLTYGGWQTPTYLSGDQYPTQQSNAAAPLKIDNEYTKVPPKELPPHGQAVPQHGIPTAGSPPKEQDYAAQQQALLHQGFQVQPEVMHGKKSEKGHAAPAPPEGPPPGVPNPFYFGPEFEAR